MATRKLNAPKYIYFRSYRYLVRKIKKAVINESIFLGALFLVYLTKSKAPKSQPAK